MIQVKRNLKKNINHVKKMSKIKDVDKSTCWNRWSIKIRSGMSECTVYTVVKHMWIYILWICRYHRLTDWFLSKRLGKITANKVAYTTSLPHSISNNCSLTFQKGTVQSYWRTEQLWNQGQCLRDVHFPPTAQIDQRGWARTLLHTLSRSLGLWRER